MKQLLSHIGSLYCCSKSKLFEKEELVQLIKEKKLSFQNQGIRSLRVSLIARSDIDFVTNFLALLLSDCAVLLLSQDSTETERQSLNSQFESSFELDGIQITDLSRQSKASAQFCLTTSGTTGIPKMVDCSIDQLARKIEFLKNHISHEEVSITASVLSLSFGHGLIGTLLFPLLTGNKVILIGPSLERLLRCSEIMNEHQVTFISATPHTYEVISKFNGASVASLKRVQTASAPFDSLFFEKVSRLAPNAKIYNAYGLTEFYSWIAFNEISPGTLPNLIALPQDSILWDESLQANESEGLLYLKASSLPAHWDGIEDNIIWQGEKYLGTGDVLKKTTHGYQIFSRLDDRISINAIKFYPQEIEDFYRTALGIKDIYFIHLSDFRLNVLLIESEENDQMQKEVMDLSMHLSGVKRPQRVLYAERIPRTQRGKISRKELQQLCLNLIK